MPSKYKKGDILIHQPSARPVIIESEDNPPQNKPGQKGEKDTKHVPGYHVKWIDEKGTEKSGTFPENEFTKSDSIKEEDRKKLQAAVHSK
jgi:hypothetical protein